MIRRGAAALALALTLAASAAADEARPPAPGRAPLTAKERLGDKASDEQRVNDCKVPAGKRGTRPRPAECDTDKSR